jgi:tRNA (guanine-N7-)-methyltransferase
MPILSNQNDIHPDLEDLVKKHFKFEYKKPLQSFNQVAFDYMLNRIQSDGRSPIFDSGCGVGESTIRLAKMNPDNFVVGIDKSVSRMKRTLYYMERENEDIDNYLLVRANVIDIWRLAAKSAIKLSGHYLLYPNPWPKKKHLHRRWHGHPVFPFLLKLGGRVIVRGNWKLYLDEFAFAVNLVTGKKIRAEEYVPEYPISPFERKYQQRNETLYELSFFLD